MPTDAAQPPRTLAIRTGKSLALLAADIKLAHSVFALPFAVLGAFLARPPQSSWGRFGGQLALIVACMVLARTWAMLVNRLADRLIDARSPRTAGRAFAAGKVHPAFGWMVAGVSAAGFVLAACGFLWAYGNPWPAYLCLPVLAWLAFYSITKRFTALCHLVLGASLAMSPVAAAIAVEPRAVFTTPSLWWLAGFVMLWVGGFDVIYALQDEAFDRAQKLRSMPSMLGTRGAAWAARSLHAGSLLMLAAAWTSNQRLGLSFAIGMGLVAVLLAVEHVVLAVRLRKSQESPGLHVLFFTINGVVGCVCGVLGVIDLW